MIINPRENNYFLQFLMGGLSVSIFPYCLTSFDKGISPISKRGIQFNEFSFSQFVDTHPAHIWCLLFFISHFVKFLLDSEIIHQQQSHSIDNQIMSELQGLKQRHSQMLKLIEIKELKISVEALQQRNRNLEHLYRETEKKLTIKTQEAKRLASELVYLKLSNNKKQLNILSCDQIYQIVKKTKFSTKMEKYMKEQQKAVSANQIRRNKIKIAKTTLEEQTTVEDILRMEGVPGKILDQIEKKCEQYFEGDNDLKEILLGYIGKVNFEEHLVENSERLFEELRLYMKKKEERLKKIVREFVEQSCALVLDVGEEEL